MVSTLLSHNEKTAEDRGGEPRLADNSLKTAIKSSKSCSVSVSEGVFVTLTRERWGASVDATVGSDADGPLKAVYIQSRTYVVAKRLPRGTLNLVFALGCQGNG